MRVLLQRWSSAVLAVLLAAILVGCGSAFKKDTKQLQRKCDVVSGAPVTKEEARCIGMLYGIRNRRDCPIEVDRIDHFSIPAYRVRESCNDLAVVVARSSGRVLALMAGDEILFR